MLLYKDIVKENNPVLRNKSTDIEMPMSEDLLKALQEMDDYLTNGYDDEFTKKHDIRPGVGIAAPQIGINKKMFCIQAYDEKGDFHHLVVVNPKITSESEQLTYLKGGEGCLSVEKECRGLIMRHAKIKARCLLYNPDKNCFEQTVLTLKGYLSVIFQHEYDHLDGILFFDRVNRENPFFVPENAKPVEF